MTTDEYRAYLNGRGQPTQAASAKGKKPTSPTNALTKAIIRLLHLHGFHAWRQNNAAVYDATFGGYRANSTQRGTSDVIGYRRACGRFAAVEVKTGADTLSPEQTAFLNGVRQAGGFACEGRSLDQVAQELRAYLLTLPT